MAENHQRLEEALEELAEAVARGNAHHDIAQALRETLISPNEPDRNLEPANVVDALAALARNLLRGLSGLAEELQGVAEAMRDVAQALHERPPPQPEPGGERD